jgi:hypothetical protein
LDIVEKKWVGGALLTERRACKKVDVIQESFREGGILVFMVCKYYMASWPFGFDMNSC